MRTIFKIVFVYLFAIQIQAQEKLITGTVTSAADGYPIPGVSVIIVNSVKGTDTDYDGKYKIKAKETDVLQFSSIGYKTKTVKVNKQNVISLALEEDSDLLEEVVVVGYGTIKRSNRKSSISKVKRRKLNNVAAPRINQALRGQVSGVNIQAQNGVPGVAPTIKIRGAGSITANDAPTVVVDGVVVDSSFLANLDMNDVESVEVLKDASSAAIYGNKASNGVIVIGTDKNSNVNKASVDNNESYAEINENTFKRTSLSPLSTFSIDVDNASYSNVRRMINNGVKVNPSAVKIEEMINYFDYQYAQPEGEHPFAIHTEVAKTPWHADTKIVKVGLQGKTYKNEELPASNLTFLIDVSGSMDSQNKLGLLKSAFKLLVNQLREKDKVSIVVYAGAAGVVLEPTSGKHKEKILNALYDLEAGGSTAGGEGIKLAYKLAKKNFKKHGNNRVILATDGDFNVGASSDKAMEKLIEKERESGVFLSVLGFGYGNYQDSKLETLADKGNGNHAYIDTMQEAQKVFGKEFGGTLHTIAKDVKIQVEFNPNKVQAYRLIGYENRMLADEDFIDDTKDAGELGSGHSVTALYEVVPVGVESDYIKEVNGLKYTKSNKLSEDYNDELFTVKFRYKKPSGAKSIEMIHVQKDEVAEASEDLKFASAVALFGMQLRDSKFYNKATPEKVVVLAKAGRGEDKNGYRAEFLRLVKAVD